MLVVWNHGILNEFPIILGRIISTDELIFFRGVETTPPTSIYIYMYWDLSYSATSSGSVQFRLAMFSQWHVMTHTHIHARAHTFDILNLKGKGKNFRCSFRSDLYFVGTVSQMVYGCVSSCPCDYDRKLAAVCLKFFLKDISPKLGYEHFNIFHLFPYVAWWKVGFWVTHHLGVHSWMVFFRMGWPDMRFSQVTPHGPNQWNDRSSP